MKRRYYNLGQWTGHRVCYFRSTDIEQKNWHRLLWSVSDEMLYFLSIGDEIVIYEKSKKKRGKVERIFIPVLVDLLNYIYFGDKPKSNHLKQHYVLAKEAMGADSGLERKYAFWRGKIACKIKLSCKTMIVKREPNIVYGGGHENKGNVA